MYPIGTFPMVNSVDSPISHEDLVVESSYGSNMNGKDSSNRQGRKNIVMEAPNALT